MDSPIIFFTTTNLSTYLFIFNVLMALHQSEAPLSTLANLLYNKTEVFLVCPVSDVLI